MPVEVLTVARVVRRHILRLRRWPDSLVYRTIQAITSLPPRSKNRTDVQSAIGLLPLAFNYQLSAFSRWPFAIGRLPLAISRLPFAFGRLPFAINHHQP